MNARQRSAPFPGFAARKRSRSRTAERVRRPIKQFITLKRIASLRKNFPPGLSQPALRALAGAGYARLGDLAQATEAELRELHGIGRKAIAILRGTLEEHGQSLKP